VTVPLPLDDGRIRALSEYSEKVARKRFEKLRLKVTRLDGVNRRRPDFLVSEGAGPLLICEVKTILSAGYLDEREAHISTEDPSLINRDPLRVPGFCCDGGFQKVDEVLADAVDQHRSLMRDCPELGGVPFVVALFLDFFADCFNLLPREMPEFPTLSGLLKVEHAWEIRKAAHRLSLAELREVIDGIRKVKLGAETKRWRLLQNERARTPLPEHFVMTCITAEADAPETHNVEES
jgi:hypothetical protein